MLKRIQKLSKELANQIAAGEVVERPSSIVKELLENSLDANSTDIKVYIEGGGKRLIRVVDNGDGICKEDLELALLQHATSKIFNLADLEAVASFGFRGEALASISAVSKFKLISATEEQDMAWGIETQFSKQHSIQQPYYLFPQPKIKGTTIEVRDLFYNVPARRKFLKSEKTEFLHLEEIFKRLVLCKPNISFSLFNEDKLYKRLAASKTVEASERRIAQIAGEKFIQTAQYIEAESNGLTLRGWLGDYDQQRAQPDLQYFYVNDRIVRDKVITHAIREGYKTFCLPGRYPAFILYLTLDNKSVDVNVHPTKNEVRFREAKIVHGFIAYAIAEALQQFNQQKIVSIKNNNPIPIVEDTPILEKNSSFEIINKSDTKKIDPTREENSNHTSAKAFGKPFALLGNALLLARTPNQPASFLNHNENILFFDVKEVQKKLIVYELWENYQKNNITIQQLFMPKYILISEKISEMIEKFKQGDQNTHELYSEINQIEWQRLGFDFSVTGPNTLLLRCIPSLLHTAIEKYQLSEKLEVFINNLLKIKTLTLCLEYIAIFISENSQLSLQDTEDLLIKLEKYHLSKADEKLKLYRSVTVGQLKAFLF